MDQAVARPRRRSATTFVLAFALAFTALIALPKPVFAGTETTPRIDIQMYDQGAIRDCLREEAGSNVQYSCRNLRRGYQNSTFVINPNSVTIVKTQWVSRSPYGSTGNGGGANYSLALSGGNIYEGCNRNGSVWNCHSQAYNHRTYLTSTNKSDWYRHAAWNWAQNQSRVNVCMYAFYTMDPKGIVEC